MFRCSGTIPGLVLVLPVFHCEREIWGRKRAAALLTWHRLHPGPPVTLLASTMLFVGHPPLPQAGPIWLSSMNADPLG